MSLPAMYCSHANEVPIAPCKCVLVCYCRENTCKATMNPDHMDNLSTGHGERVKNKGGRPRGATSSMAIAQAKRVARARTKLVMERASEMGLEALGEVRVPLRTDAPERTVTQAKEAALKLLNSMLWTIEQRAAEHGVNEMDEARVLKLLAGLNAALPKQAENPAKPVDEMTEEELRRAAGK